MPTRVLLVEDEPSIAAPLARTLEDEGHLVSVCERGEEAIEVAHRWEPDLILLDLKLPDIDGMEVATRVRARSSVPIIMLTARGRLPERVAGLEAGADDYLVKPFDVDELLARIRAVLRRPAREPIPPGDPVRFADLELHQSARRATQGGREISLAQKEFELLRILMMRPGETVRREDLCRSIWSAPVAQAGKSLDVHMSWLRNKLGDDPSRPRYIETVRGIGFRLVQSPTQPRD